MKGIGARHDNLDNLAARIGYGKQLINFFHKTKRSAIVLARAEFMSKHPAKDYKSVNYQIELQKSTAIFLEKREISVQQLNPQSNSLREKLRVYSINFSSKVRYMFTADHPTFEERITALSTL